MVQLFVFVSWFKSQIVPITVILLCFGEAAAFEPDFDSIQPLYPLNSTVSTHPGPVSMLFGSNASVWDDFNPLSRLWGSQIGRVCLAADTERSKTPLWCISSRFRSLQAMLPLGAVYEVEAVGELPTTPAALAAVQRAEEAQAASSKHSSDVKIAMATPTGEDGAPFREVWKRQLTVIRESRDACVFGQEPCMTQASKRPHCADISTFRFLVYPEDQAVRIATSWLQASVNATQQDVPLAVLMRLLLAHPLRTRDPDEACVRIPAVNTACASGMCGARSLNSAILASLPLWDNGKDHLLWDYSDHWPLFDPGRAILAKSSFGEQWDVEAALKDGGMYGLTPDTHPANVPNLQPLVAGYDVAVPLTFYRCQMPLFGHLARARAKVGVHASFRSRRLLASFMGAAYDIRRHPSTARAELALAVQELEQTEWLPRSEGWYNRTAADDGAALPVVVRLACVVRVQTCVGVVRSIVMSSRPQCPEWQRLSEADADITASTGAPMPGKAGIDSTIKSAFDGLLASSRFGFVIPGEGMHSYRLLEVLGAGVVPVLLPGSAVPFHDLIDWDQIAVSYTGEVNTPGIRSLLQQLRDMPQTEWKERLDAGQTAFQRLLSSPRRHMDAVFATLAGRFRKALKGQRHAPQSSEHDGAVDDLLERRARWTQSTLQLNGLDTAPESWFDAKSAMSGLQEAHRESKSWFPELEWATSPSAALAALRAPLISSANATDADPQSSTAVSNGEPWPESASLLWGLAFVDQTGFDNAQSQNRAVRAVTSAAGRLLAPAPIAILGNPGALLEALAPALCEGTHPGPMTEAIRAVGALQTSQQGADGRPLPVTLSGAESAFNAAKAVLQMVEACTSTPALRIARGDALGSVLVILADSFARTGALRQAVTAAQAAIVYTSGSPAFRQGVLAADRTNTVLSALTELTTRYQNAVRESLAATALHGTLYGFRVKDFPSSSTFDALGLPRHVSDELWNRLRSSSVGSLSSVLPEPGPLTSRLFSQQTAPSAFLASMSHLAKTEAAQKGAQWLDAAAPWIRWSASHFALRLQQDDEAVTATIRRANHIASLVPGRDWLPGMNNDDLSTSNDAAIEHWKHIQVLPAAAIAANDDDDGPAVDSVQRARVAVVSLCSYDAAKTSITAVSMTNKLAYCRRHGYDCMLETQRLDQGRPPAWGKVRYMLQHRTRADWVAWIDCDSLFTNFSLPLEGIMARAGVLLSLPGSPRDEEDADSEAPVVVLSEDGASLNTGVFLVRNCELGLQLLEAVWGGPDNSVSVSSPFESHPWWEQAAFIDAVTFGPLAESLAGKILAVPQAALNGYPIEIAAKFKGSGRPLHAVWQPGDSIVSFSGCARMLQDRDTCEGYLSRFEAIGMQERWRDESLVRQQFGLPAIGPP